MTGWLLNREIGADDLSAGAARRLSDIATYRQAVTDVLSELTEHTTNPSLARVERVLYGRLTESEFAAVLSATPSGPEAAVDRILRDIRSYRRQSANSAGDLAAMIRITLLTQIDVLWWGHVPAYKTDADVLANPDLLHLNGLRHDGLVTFNYRLQTSSKLVRALRIAERAAAPNRAPAVAGLRFACARAELIVLLNRIAAEFARFAPPGTPRLWVTSLTRSVAYQRHLRSLGYAALLPSAHCVGYAADVEMTWLRKFDADHTLQAVLLAHQRDGDVNVIDEGECWHICARPGAGRALRLIPRQR
ncbi:MAG: hypothetical protein J2P28_00880 [Actinobacteria bacterium]|nr:hypothetical protein [Actinomycetota bacterium]MBO0834055.1 hypothetical protein [Actinomycetota bacterium]